MQSQPSSTPASRSASRERSGEVNRPLNSAAASSLPLFTAAAGSILFSYGYHLGTTILILIGSILLALTLFFLFIIVSTSEKNRTQKMIFAAIYLFICLLCALYCFLRIASLAKIPVSGSGDEYTASVIRIEPGRYTDRVFLSVSSLRSPETSPFTAVAFPRAGLFTTGDQFALDEKAEQIDADHPFASMRTQGIHYSVRLNGKNHAFIQRGIPGLRENIRNRIILHNNELYGERAGSVVSALYLGDGYFVDRRSNYDFLRAGVLHILAASGSHVAIIAGLPLMLCCLLNLPYRRSLALISLLLGAFFYLTCAPVSLFRACIMFWIFAFFRIIRRGASTYQILYLAGIFILLLHPWEIFSLGFQLSFGATFGILLLFKAYASLVPKIPFKVGESLSMTLAAQAGIFPISALALGQLNMTAFAANLVIIPFITLLMIVSFATGLISVIHPSSGIFIAHLVSSAFSFLFDLCSFFARLPGHVAFTRFPWWLMTPYIILIIAGLYSYRRTMARFLIIISLLVWCIPCYQQFSKERTDKVFAVNDNCTIDFTGDRTVISGSIHSREEMLLIEKATAERGYSVPEMMISDLSNNSIFWLGRFIRRNPVSSVTLPQNIPLNRSFSDFCETLEREGVTLAFEPKK
jgi:ComEC/Rec2-related protein